MSQNDTGVNEITETPADPFADLADMPADLGDFSDASPTADEQQQREEVMEAVAPEGGSMFMLILKDGVEPNSVDIAGLQRPEEYNPQSPAHVIGAWLRENFEEVAARARQAEFERQAKAAFAKAAPNDPDSVPADETSAPRIITDERERTIVSSGPAVPNLGVGA